MVVIFFHDFEKGFSGIQLTALWTGRYCFWHGGSWRRFFVVA